MPDNEIYIKVGIPTAGRPKVRPEEGVNILENQLIGLGFHWQKVIRSVLPGKLFLNDDPVFTVLNRLPLETYLECVIGSEMNPDSPIEFLKAHAVISRSWAAGKLRSKKRVIGEMTRQPDRLIIWEDESDHQGFDVCSDDHCQRYQGYQFSNGDDEIRSSKTAEAVRETSGLVLKDKEGNLVDARFSKCCGGKTELFSTAWQDREMPCLESFDDPWCDLSKLSPSQRDEVLKTILKDYDMANQGGYEWEADIDKSQIRKNLSEKFGYDIGEIKRIDPLERGKSGRIKLLKIAGAAGEMTFGKELAVRKLLSGTHLYSSNFNITDLGNSFHLRGKGWGHGVGLCQIGAAVMALKGYSFREILSFYYPGSEISALKCN